MRIAILDTREACEHGNYPLLWSAQRNEHFERDLFELFEQQQPWWRPGRRRRFEHFKSEVERVTGELRQNTVYVVE